MPSSPDTFHVYGWLQSNETLATLRDSHLTSLKKPGEMIGDEIVMMLLLNTGNTFYQALKPNTIVITPIEFFYLWESQVKNGTTALPKSSTIDYANYRLIAFPVYVKSPPHFTLGLLTNLKWSVGNTSAMAPEWILLHFDSCPCTPDSQKLALGFGKHLLGLEDGAEIKRIEVPVIRQPAGSNDCGFYPAHFLEIILHDVDYFIDECLKAANEMLPHDSAKVKSLWKYNQISSLRQQALFTYKFYERLEKAVRQDQDLGSWVS